MKKTALILLLMVAVGWGTTWYVSKNGDNTDGLSWSTAWLYIDSVNANMAGADTCYFGTGFWRSVRINAPTSGASFSDRTCYACSAFVQGITELWGSDSVYNWVQHSGNIYKAYWEGTDCLWDQGCQTLAQDDSLLWYKDVLDSVNGPGEFYQNATYDTLYAWIWTGDDPDNYDMEASCKTVFYLHDGANYTTIWGFNMKFAKGSLVTLRGDTQEGGIPDSVFIEHCNMSRVSSSVAGNSCCIKIHPTTAGFEDTLYHGYWNRIRACSLSYAIDPGMDFQVAGDFGSGLVIYRSHYTVVESCYISSPLAVGIQWKHNGIGDVTRYNTIEADGYLGTAIAVRRNPRYDSVYGNIIIGNNEYPLTTMRMDKNNETIHPPWEDENVFFYNNTFYNVKKALESRIDNPDERVPGLEFKYNVIYIESLGDFVIAQIKQVGVPDWTIDSNIVCSDEYDFMIEYTHKTLDQWRNDYGFDVNSDTNSTALGFNDPENGDFTRPNATQEMNLTYGGQHWHIYGALQNEAIWHDLFFVDTNVTSVLVVDDYSDTSEVDTLFFVIDDDSDIASPIKIDTISSGITDPDSTTFTGLTANTQYWCWAIISNSVGRDTSYSINVYTLSEFTPKRWKGVKSTQ